MQRSSASVLGSKEIKVCRQSRCGKANMASRLEELRIACAGWLADDHSSDRAQRSGTLHDAQLERVARVALMAIT